MTADPDDLVVDPFCGGGSGAVATKQMGREYIGCEIDQHYQKTAQEKLDEAEPARSENAFASFHHGKIVSIRDCDIKESMYWINQAS